MKAISLRFHVKRTPVTCDYGCNELIVKLNSLRFSGKGWVGPIE